MIRARFSNPDQLRLLDNPSWSQCEGLIKAFEDAWQRGQSPAIDAFLQVDDPMRRALLVELVHADLEFRLKSGESARVEAYLDNYPELSLDRGTTLELVATEYELRRRSERVDPEEYRGRFPQLAVELFRDVTLAGAKTQAPGAPILNVDEPPAADLRKWPEIPGYEILEEIGRGGMGVVYKARDPQLGRFVALKFLPLEYARDADRLERFLREARTASALNHPNICTVHSLGEHERRPYIVMEFIEGQTLRAIIARRPRIDESARLVGQAARALSAAHAAGIVHRDIKPENIMLREDGYAKVLDFGLARRLPSILDGAVTPGDDTDPGALLGTVAYMSPEQARGDVAQSASDIFALGIVLYQLLTADHPFGARTPLETLHAISAAAPAPAARVNPEVPVELSGLVEAMLHKDARLRPTATEVETALVRFKQRKSVRATSLSLPRPVVHRQKELGQLRAALSDADAGRASIVCVAGEPGIGKTTLVEDFLAEIASREDNRLIARGQCSERLVDTEAYLPVIDALESLLRSDGRGTIGRLVKVVAPAWYAQLAPAAIPVPDEDTLASRAASQQAMLREFCNLLTEVSRLGTLVLFFDDVHWADISTVDLLAHLGQQFHAQRASRALRVLVVATYRPTELLLGPHPFHNVRLDLQSRGTCSELALSFLGREDIDSYLSLAFPGHKLPAHFGDVIYARTEGSPLFMADLLTYLRDRGVIAQSREGWSLARELPDLRDELPESVRGMIQRKLERLSNKDRRILAAASVQGHEFDSAAVAGGVALAPADVEERLQSLDRVHGLVRLLREQELPDGALTVRCRFVHVLYQHALFDELSPNRRAALAGVIARTMQSHHKPDDSAVAAQLACLYEVGRDFSQAARHFWLAAQNAARVFAHGEAIVLSRRGLHHLLSLPATTERAALERALQTTIGLQLQITKGYAAPEAEQAYSRARELCSSIGAAEFPVLWGLWLCHKVRSELPKAQEMAEELLALARRVNDPALALQAHQALGITAWCRGEQTAALRNIEQVAALYDPHRHRSHSALFGQDPGVICKAYGAVVLWLLGYPDSAAEQSRTAIEMSRGLSPTSQAVALHFASMVHHLRDDGPRARDVADRNIAISSQHGLPFWRAGGTILSGWALAKGGAAAEGLERLRQGIVDWHTTGSTTYETYYLGLLAEVLADQNQLDEATRALEEALVLAKATSEGLYEPELYRLRGEFLLRRAAAPDDALVEQVADDFRQALRIARRQEAKSLALRAAMSLARLDRRFGRPNEGHAVLGEVYSSFTEGFETPDLRAARALLA